MTEWRIASMGSVRGFASCGEDVVSVRLGKSTTTTSGSLELRVEDGKFGDSEDSFLFAYCAIDPTAQNFKLRAKVSAQGYCIAPDQQSGFGIVVSDTDVAETSRSRHRNHVLLGCFGRERTLGLRAVWGYASPAADKGDEGRHVDSSRKLTLDCDDPFAGATFVCSLEKTDAGLIAAIDDEVCQIAGCDFLMAQNPQALYVGFAAARNVDMTVSDIVLEVSEGVASHTSEGELVDTPSWYPFAPSVLEVECKSVRVEDAVLQVHPAGTEQGDGSTEAPLSLEAAIRRAGPGCRIVLADGFYEASTPIIVPPGQNGTCQKPIELVAEHPRACAIDGAHLPKGSPLFVLAGNNWHISGLIFLASPLSGLIVMGNFNRIENCEALGNGDTGILVISRPDARRGAWPQGNYIVDCESHDNCDEYSSNADGFGAKLRVGRGNVFYRCTAYRNVDDGFDLYTKSLFDPTEPVELDSCIAFENGRVLPTGDGGSRRQGSGFKLGGESQPVEHEAWNSVAYANKASGFTANSNPACHLFYCSARANGTSYRHNYALMGQWARGPISMPPRFCNLDIAQSTKTALAHFGAQVKPGGGMAFDCLHRIHAKQGADFDRNKNVLFVISTIGGGGAEHVTCRLATQMSAAYNTGIIYFANNKIAYPVGERVALIDASFNSKPEATLVRKAIRYVRASIYSVFSLLRAVRKYDIDTSISMLGPPNRLNSIFGAKRTIVSERNDPSCKPPKLFKQIKASCRRADFAVFQSKKVQGMFDEGVRLKSCVIANPIELDCSAGPVRKKKIVSVGRLHPQKNHRLLLHAFALFHESHPEHHLHVYGEGWMLEELEALAESLGVAEYAHFEGFCENVQEEISDAEQFVLSSDFEGLSNALLEAMLMGIPCISTACTGSDELITDGVDGLLVPLGDAHALREAMCRLADDADLRSRIADNAMNRAFEFSPENIGRKWERII